jgi:hypothetical protein
MIELGDRSARPPAERRLPGGEEQAFLAPCGLLAELRRFQLDRTGSRARVLPAPARFAVAVNMTGYTDPYETPAH